MQINISLRIDRDGKDRSVKGSNKGSNRSWRFSIERTDVLSAAGVGENLHNHVSYTLSWTIDQPNVYDLNWAAATEYIAFQKGPMSATGLSQLTGILPSVYATPDHPDLQLFFGGYQAACATTGLVGATMNDNGRSISMSPTMLQPRSRGKRFTSDAPPRFPQRSAAIDAAGRHDKLGIRR